VRAIKIREDDAARRDAARRDAQKPTTFNAAARPRASRVKRIARDNRAGVNKHERIKKAIGLARFKRRISLAGKSRRLKSNSSPSSGARAKSWPLPRNCGHAKSTRVIQRNASVIACFAVAYSLLDGGPPVSPPWITGERASARTDGWTAGWLDGWMDGRTDGRTDGRIQRRGLI